MKPRSLVLVTVDCLRADRLGFQGYAQPLTPFLDSVAKNSLVFSNAVVAGAPTYFSFPAILASRYPLGLGREVLGIAPGEATLASVLKDAGYETAAFVAGNPYLTPRFGYDQGFQHFFDFLGSNPVPPAVEPAATGSADLSALNRRIERLCRRTKLTGAAYDELYFRYCQWLSARRELSMDHLRRYPAADVLIKAACDWLKTVENRPYFLWIHLMDPHHPYYPPREALGAIGCSRITPKRALFLNSFWNRTDVSKKRLQRYRPEILALYDAGACWVDEQLSRLAEALKDLRRWEESLFVVTGDHGEEFLEHGNRYHSPHALPEELTHVPLLVHAPGISPGKLQGVFSLIHLAPTLLEALEVETPPSFCGSSVWKQASSGNLPELPAITECISGCNNPFLANNRNHARLMAIRDGYYKLVIDYRKGTDDLYDLRDDPAEQHPLPFGEHSKERARLLQLARKHSQQHRTHRDGKLALRARLREIRQRIDLKPGHAGASLEQRAVQIGEHG